MIRPTCEGEILKLLKQEHPNRLRASKIADKITIFKRDSIYNALERLKDKQLVDHRQYSYYLVNKPKEQQKIYKKKCLKCGKLLETTNRTQFLHDSCFKENQRIGDYTSNSVRLDIT